MKVPQGLWMSAMFGWFLLGGGGEASAGPTTITVKAPTALMKITLRTPTATLVLETAHSNAERTHGLMNRKALAPRHGMIFVFPCDQELHFWMKDTLISLDMVFVDTNGKVTAIASDVPASTPTMADDDIARREGRGRYVIELPAREANLDGLAAGAHLNLPSFP